MDQALEQLMSDMHLQEEMERRKKTLEKQLQQEISLERDRMLKEVAEERALVRVQDVRVRD